MRLPWFKAMFRHPVTNTRENYKEFMRLRDEWIEASIELAKNRKSQGGKAVKA